MEKEQTIANKTPLISVIVPVYKVEQFIHRCVDSILNQTYTNLEIILVDDGSPDRCGEICDEYAEKDSRIRVIHQENSGVSAARNAGLDICTGDYIAFVDSDDYIEADMLQQLLSGIRSADFCGCGFVNETQSGDALSVTMPKQEISLPGLELLRQHYSGENGCLGITTFYVSGKLYRKKIFEQIRFQRGVVFEDIHLMPYLLMQCDMGKFLPYSGYHYVVNPDSITNKKDAAHAKKCYEDCFEIWKDHEALYHKQGWNDLAVEVKCLTVEKIINHVLADSIPSGCEMWSRKLLRQTTIELMTKPIGRARKLRYAAFSLFGATGYRILRKIVK